ncbi:MAG: ABC transporter substrate-binding protein [Dehalococcoidia bacterium]|nr:ABC transporter substrate-binding protein [Dehalococcoidia bacterium]MSQ17008.1 ABC transporter substrate-binding protein [Dehalococcoidia bacterium]
MPTNTRRHALRLMEVLPSVFYTPVYAALAGGFWEAEGLDVSFSTCPPRFSHVLSALNQNAADIVQGGVMRSIIAADWGAETVPAHFAMINARDGFFVLSRQPIDPFSWDMLRGATVIPLSFSPTPWASFQYALRRHGVPPSELKLMSGLSLEASLAAFRRGDADFIHLPEPEAGQLLAEGSAHLAVALGPENGHIAYSSFAATNRFLDAQPDAVRRFTRGFGRALRWLAASDATVVGDAIAPFFPGFAKEQLVQSVARYQAQDTWPADPRLEEPEYQGLQDILMAAGLVKERQPYAKVVRPEFAREVAG